MGMTTAAIRASARPDVAVIEKAHPQERLIALAGNPNVGKSTVFNALTGLRQHTGNWPGKTVTNAQGVYRKGDNDYRIVDLPGTYSLLSNSIEEEIARDFLCFGGADATVVVADIDGTIISHAGDLDPRVREYGHRLLDPASHPLPVRPVLRLVRFVTVGLLPDRLRDAYGFPWSPVDRRRFDALMRVSAAAYRRLPRAARELPTALVLRASRRSVAPRG